MNSAATDRNALSSRLCAGAGALGIEMSTDVRERLLDYVQLLARWNETYNLTAVRDPQEMITRHLLDSLSVARYVAGDSVADVGSGAGLPGIPLAILAPQRSMTLIDSNGKKASFLREAVRSLGLSNVRVVAQRAEDARGAFSCVTARAFAALADMLGLCGHLLAADGVLLALKGHLHEDELASLPEDFRVVAVHPLDVPGLGAARHVIVVQRAPALAHEYAA